MNKKEIIAELKKFENPVNKAGMAKFGIDSSKALGLRAPQIYAITKKISKNHDLALEMWEEEIHEAKHVAYLIEETEKITKKQMNKWANDFYSWDLVDGCVGFCFDKTKFAYNIVFDWSKKEKEFVKRAGFVMMCALAVHDKKRPDDDFLPFFPLILEECTDNRNFVKKAVNWAIRQMGKRSRYLNEKCIALAEEVLAVDDKTARWIAKDAIRELTNEKIQRRLK